MTDFRPIWPRSKRLNDSLQSDKKNISYTRPGIKHESSASISDSEQQLIKQCFASFDNATAYREGFKKLLAIGSLDVALLMTDRILTHMGHGLGKAGQASVMSSLKMEIWSLRFQLMLATKKYLELNEELSPFDDLEQPDTYNVYVDPAIDGSLVPFSMRLVHAEAIFHTPMCNTAFQRVKHLEDRINEILQTLGSTENAEAVACWTTRKAAVLKLKCRLLNELGLYETAMLTSKELNSIEQSHATQLAMVRMALSIGDETAVERILSQIAPYNPNGMVLHKAFRAAFHGAYAQCGDYAQRKEESKTLQSQNLAALSKLYLGKPFEMVEDLRKFRKDGPFPPATALNFKTVTEICCSQEQKNAMLATVE